MKVFYFGSVCADEVFNETVRKSRVKPSASAQNFESALLKGLSANQDAEVTAVSAESIATFPHGNRLFLKKRQDVIADNCSTAILPAINLPGLKQIGHANGAARMFRTWVKENAGQDKCVLVYGLYPQVVKRLQKACRKYGCKIFAMITDVPSTMFTYTKSRNLLKRLFSGKYRKTAVSLQDKFDGYVYLTEEMKDEVAPGKPYTVVETIVDTAVFDGIAGGEKADPPALMYAGALYQKYGVDAIVEAFEQVKTNCQLWLFGAGDYEEKIRECAEKNPKIRFFGRVSREEVLRKEQEAALLLNIRNAEDVYTKYSFPSKMIEYMLSGTPVFTTKLSGIPAEYNPYCYLTTDRNAQKIAEQIDEILAGGQGQLNEFGACAKKFVVEQKNCFVQANKVLLFLRQQTRRES